MRIVPSVVWTLEGDAGGPLDPRLVPLLKAIAASGSLAAAIAACGISYRAGWGLLHDYQRRLGDALVLLERGRGATLTVSGSKLLAADAAAGSTLMRLLPRLAIELHPSTRPAARTAARPLSLRIAASHDLALAALAAALAATAGLQLELTFTGSLRALQEFAEGRADVAGFHVPISGRREWDLTPFLRGLNPRRDRLVHFVDRDQGLILPRGNPARVKNLRDVATQRLRFINRQRGSGTRVLIDQMLAHDRIDPSALDGYGNEEFTHPAVAATVASGGADAGFGLRAAAAEYRLAFVPLVRERYFLALRTRALASAAVTRLLQVLQGAPLREIVQRLPGYRATEAGVVVTLDAMGVGEQR